MGFASATAKINAQNRRLQKSIRAKYDQQIYVDVSGDSTISRLDLSKRIKGQADYIRINKLIKKGILAIALFIPFAYYAYKWIDANLISF